MRVLHRNAKDWVGFPPVPEHFVKQLRLPYVVCQVLYNRGLKTPEAVAQFLHNTKSQLNDPFLLPGMEEACQRLYKALEQNETIGIFGDFDVDGVTATALLSLALHQLGGRVVPYIPHREEEGHGLNLNAIQLLKTQGCSLLVTVDCGLTSVDEVQYAKETGMEVIITDHHTPQERLPDAAAIVCPRLASASYPFRELTGAGLALKLAQAVFSKFGKAIPGELFGLAALGTIADLAPLVGENRAIVKEGLETLNTGPSIGLEALCDRAGLRLGDIDSEAVSFVIAPRLNASGRLDHASLSYRLLMAHDVVEASELANRLESLNRERQALTYQAYARAREEVMARKESPYMLIVAGEWLTPGICGLVASKLIEEFYRPAVVVALNGEMARASARTIPELNIVEALSRCGELFTRYGGHPQAAGFVAPRSAVPEISRRLEEHAERRLKPMELRPRLLIDADVPLHNLTGEAYRLLKQVEPYGVGNPVPVFRTGNVEVLEARTSGGDDQHLFLRLRHGGAVWDAIAFNHAASVDLKEARVDVVYTLRTRSFSGMRTLALNVLDFRPSGKLG